MLKKRSATEAFLHNSFFPAISYGWGILSGHWIPDCLLVCLAVNNKDDWEVFVLVFWHPDNVCWSVHQITEASGLSLIQQEEDLLKCESDGPAGPIIVHRWRIHWRARWIDAGLLKALPTAMAAVIYACLCPLGFYLHISSLRASVHPFPHMKGAYPALCAALALL